VLEGAALRGPQALIVSNRLARTSFFTIWFRIAARTIVSDSLLKRLHKVPGFLRRAAKFLSSRAD